MTVVQPAKVRIEIYRAPKVFSDHFLEQDPSSHVPLWVATPAGQVAFDGDYAVLTIKAGETEQHFSKAVDYVTVSSGMVLVSRLIALTCSGWALKILRDGQGAWDTVASGSVAGLVEASLAAFVGQDIVGVDIVATGTAGQTLTVDSLVVCSELVVPEDGDLVNELRLSLPTLKDGVQGANFTLLNKAAYEDVAEHDRVIIYLSRSGSVGVKRFGGLIKKTQVDSVRYGEEYLHVWCHGYATELQRPPARFTASYTTAVNGRLIVEAALNLCRYLVKHPTASLWFDSAGASGSTDDRIASSHALNFDSETPYKAVTQVLDDADNGADVGFDAYETPAGCLVGHLRGSLDFTCGVAPSLRSCLDTVDACQVVNKQTVYGAAGKIYPVDGEFGTEEGASEWTCDYGTLIDADVGFNVSPAFGSYMLVCRGDQTEGKAQFRRAIPLSIGFGKNAAKDLSFSWAYGSEHGVPNLNVEVRIYAPDSDNYFFAVLSHDKAGQEWQKETSNDAGLTLGSGNMYDATVNDSAIRKWQVHNSPSWTQATELCFIAYADVAPSTDFYFCIDHLFFGGIPFSAISESSASQAVYGVVEGAPEVDSALLSDAACQLRADAIIAASKDAQRMLDPVTVDGDAAFLPGSRVYVKGAYFVLREVVDVVRDSVWDAELKI